MTEHRKPKAPTRDVFPFCLDTDHFRPTGTSLANLDCFEQSGFATLHGHSDHLSAYDYCWLLSDSRWAWEFLRRNEDFLRDANLRSADDLSFVPACHQITLVRPRNAQTLAERWGLAFFPEPEHDGLEADAIWSGGIYSRRVHTHIAPRAPNEASEIYDRTVAICRITHFTDMAGREHLLLKGNGCVIQVICTGMSLLAREPVKLSMVIDSLDEFQTKLKTLQRAQRVYDPQAEAEIPEWTRHSLALRNALVALDCHDAGKTYFETAAFIYGEARARAAWDSPSRAMKDEMKRALARAKELRDGGYASLLGPVQNALELA